MDKTGCQMTIANVLHHRTGGSERSQFDQHTALYNKKDRNYLYYIFCDGLPYEIGKEIVYCESNYDIISRIIEKITGKKQMNGPLKTYLIPYTLNVLHGPDVHKDTPMAETDYVCAHKIS